MQSDDGTASVYHFVSGLCVVFCKSKLHIGDIVGLGGMILLRYCTFRIRGFDITNRYFLDSKSESESC